MISVANQRVEGGPSATSSGLLSLPHRICEYLLGFLDFAKTLPRLHAVSPLLRARIVACESTQVQHVDVTAAMLRAPNKDRWAKSVRSISLHVDALRHAEGLSGVLDNWLRSLTRVQRLTLLGDREPYEPEKTMPRTVLLVLPGQLRECSLKIYNVHVLDLLVGRHGKTLEQLQVQDMTVNVSSNNNEQASFPALRAFECQTYTPKILTRWLLALPDDVENLGNVESDLARFDKRFPSLQSLTLELRPTDFVPLVSTRLGRLLLHLQQRAGLMLQFQCKFGFFECGNNERLSR